MRTFLLVVFVALSSLFVSACGGTGTSPEGSTYLFFLDRMTSEEAGTITELHDATLKALNSLELPVSYDKKDNLVATVQTFTASGESIHILIEYRTVDVSMVTLTSPDGVDSYKLSGLLEEIRRNMSVI